MDGEAWWATVHGVTESRTQLSDFTFTFVVPVSWQSSHQSSSIAKPCGLWTVPSSMKNYLQVTEHLRKYSKVKEIKINS